MPANSALEGGIMYSKFLDMKFKTLVTRMDTQNPDRHSRNPHQEEWMKGLVSNLGDTVFLEINTKF
jgi:hypothetical protein